MVDTVKNLRKGRVSEVLQGSKRRWKWRLRFFFFFNLKRKKKRKKEKASKQTNLQRMLADFLLAMFLNS